MESPVDSPASGDPPPGVRPRLRKRNAPSPVSFAMRHSRYSQHLESILKLTGEIDQILEKGKESVAQRKKVLYEKKKRLQKAVADLSKSLEDEEFNLD